MRGPRMKNIKLNIQLGILIALAILLSTGCGNRIETPVSTTDSTIVYPPKNAGDITARITFYRKISKQTGKRIDEGTVFTIKEKRNIRALVDIENRPFYNNSDLMFHFDWIGENGKSIFKKRIDLLPDDSSTKLISSISISPDARQPGKYTLKVYLFRELIAEKNFELLAEGIVAPLVGKEITANITLYRKKSKKTGKLIDEGTVFKIKKKRNIRALMEITNRFGYGDRELKFRINWVGEDGKTFYKKNIKLLSSDSTNTLSSSISIYPGKRPPGKYTLRVYLFNKLIGEKKFELRL